MHLTADDLDRVGGINGLFSRYLDNAIRGVPEGILLLSRAVLDALITPEETKRAITFDALLANDDFNASIDELERVLECLKTQKLVRDVCEPAPLVRADPRSAGAEHRQVVQAGRRLRAVPRRPRPDCRSRAARRVSRESRNAHRPTADRRADQPLPGALAADDRAASADALVGAVRAGRTHRVLGRLAGETPCESALLALLEHSAPEARLGAAKAAVLLAGRMPTVAHACVTRALDDKDAGVRQARPSRFPVTPATIRSLRSSRSQSRRFAGAPWTCSPRLPKPAGP